MKAWILLALPLLACAQDNVEVHWALSINGSPTSCHETSLAAMEIVFIGDEALPPEDAFATAPCASHIPHAPSGAHSVLIRPVNQYRPYDGGLSNAIAAQVEWPIAEDDTIITIPIALASVDLTWEFPDHSCSYDGGHDTLTLRVTEEYPLAAHRDFYRLPCQQRGMQILMEPGERELRFSATQEFPGPDLTPLPRIEDTARLSVPAKGTQHTIRIQ